MVTTLSDAAVSGPNTAPGTLRQAIYDANVAPDADEIEFAANLAGSVKLSIVDDTLLGPSSLVISSPITIRGNANGVTIVRDSMAGEMRLLRVTAAGVLTLETICVSGGIARGANGTSSGEDGGTGQGGAVLSQGTVHVVASTIHSNQAIGGDAGAGGSSGLGIGGAIFNDEGILSVTNSTFSGNAVFSGSAGSIFNAFGGAIYGKNGTVTVHNSTLTNSTAITGRGLYVLARNGTATVDIQSSIIGQSDAVFSIREFQAAPDDNGQFVVTGGNNLIRTQNDFQFITASTDDPLLGPLMNNGGPTPTHALGDGSPAIDGGSNPQSLSADQRGGGFERIIGQAADMGAYEVQTAVVPELPGDYNRNNVVDAADFVLWRKTRGASVPQYSGADGNGNGEVDDGDYEVWRSHFGEMPQMGSAVQLSPGRSLPTVDAESAGGNANEPREAASSEETPGSLTLFLAPESRSTGRARIAAAATRGSVSSQELDRNLLVLQTAGLMQRPANAGPTSMAALGDASARTRASRDEAVVDAVMVAWPAVVSPTF